MLEIGDLTEERFRGMFKLVYSGDAYVVLQTKVQVCHKAHGISFM
jgi:distribution and morphology protein 34